MLRAFLIDRKQHVSGRDPHSFIIIFGVLKKPPFVSIFSFFPEGAVTKSQKQLYTSTSYKVIKTSFHFIVDAE